MLPLFISDVCCVRKTILFSLFLLSFFIPRLSAQQNSPYSRYGLGELNTGTFPVNKSLGNISSGFRSPVNINFTNPASFAALKYTTFETGIFVSSVTLQTTDERDNINNANLSHIAFAFPVAKKWGMSFGVIPFSRMDYSIEQTKEEIYSEDTLQVKKEFNGSGSLYQLYFGNAYRIKNFSVGVNVMYFFGKLYRQTNQFFTPATAFYFDNARTISNYYSDLLFSGGIQYSDTLAKDLTFTLGANARFPKNIAITSETVWERIDLDTIPVNYDSSGSMNMPVSYGAGITLGKGQKWLVGAQFDYTGWSKYQSFEQKDSFLADSWTMGMGGEFIPDHKARNYFKTIQYRAGFYIGTDYLKFSATQLNKYGITFGIGLPVKRTLSRFNIGFEVGQRGTTGNNLIKENFLKAHIGITINDLWFTKRKFD